jgi:hypothetical protein
MCPRQGPDLRRFVVAANWLVRDEIDLQIDRARARWNGIYICRLSNSARSSGRGQVLKPLGEKRQPVERGIEIGDSRRGFG